MDVKKRIEELQKEGQQRQQRLQQAQLIVQQETQALISIQGGIIELQKLLEEPKETPEGEKDNKKK